MSREELLAAINGLTLPGVEGQIAAELRDELARQVEASSQTHWASSPPRGNLSNVADLQLIELGDGSRNLSWTYRNSGDYDLNGEANISDISVLGVHFGSRETDADWDTASRADGDGNGEVTIADLTPLGANLLGQVAGYRILGTASAEDPLEEIGFLEVTKELLSLSLRLTFTVPAGAWIMFAVEPLDAADVAGARSNLCGAGIALEQFPGLPGSPVNTALPQIEFPLADSASLINTPDGLPLVGNRIGVLFAPGATVAEANALLTLIDAEVIGSDPFTDVVMLSIPQVADATALSEVLNEARASSSVQVATCDLAGIGTPDPGEIYPTYDGQGASSLRELPPARFEFDWKEFGFSFPDTSYEACYKRWGIESVRAPQGWNLRTYGQRRGTPPEALVIDWFADFKDHWYSDINLREGLVFKPVAPGRPYDTHGSQVAEILGANWWNQQKFESINPLQPKLIARDIDSSTASAVTGFLNAFSFVFAQGLAVNPEVVVVNNSWGLSTGFADVSNAEWMDPLGDLYNDGATRFAADHRDNFLICNAAGYEGDVTGALLPYDSAFSNVAVRYPAGHYICCELIDEKDEYIRNVRINLGGTVSAPGYEMPLTGTSFSTPMVSSLISYLWSLDPDLSWQQVKELVTGAGFAVPTNGGTKPRIDVFNAVMGIDKLRAAKVIQQAMVDVDDGTPDGQTRLDPFDGTTNTSIATQDGQRGDGLTTMRDFRAWRDALLDVESTLSEKLLDGPALHFKRDLNFNGLIGLAPVNPPHAYAWTLPNVPPNPGEHIYSRYDFNGDGLLDLQAATVNGVQVTDLEMLTDVDLWQANELDGYVEGIYVDPGKEGTTIASDTWQPARYLLANRDVGSAAPQELQDLPDYLHSFDLHLMVDFSVVPVEISSLEVKVVTELWPDGVDNNGEDGVDEPFEQVFERTAQITRGAELPYVVTLPLWTGKARVKWDSNHVAVPLAGTFELKDLKFGEDRPATIPTQEWHFEDMPPAWQGIGNPSCAVINDLPAVVCGSFSLNQVLYRQAADSRAFSWNAPSVVKSTTNVSYTLGLVEAGGVPCVCVALSKSPPPGMQIEFIRASNPEGSSWEAPIVVAVNQTGEAGLENPVMALIGAKPAISYCRRMASPSDSNLEYAYANDAAGSSWAAPVTARAFMDFHSLAAMADIGGRPTLLFQEAPTADDDWLMYIMRGATAEGGFGSPVLLGPEVPRALANINGTPAYLTVENATLTYRKANDPNGQTWASPVTFDVLTPGATPGWFLAEVSGQPAIGYSTAAGFYYMRAADADGVLWPAPVNLLQRTSTYNCYITGSAVIEDRPMFIGSWPGFGSVFGIQR